MNAPRPDLFSLPATKSALAASYLAGWRFEDEGLMDEDLAEEEDPFRNAG
jgi:hypothetical protein